METLPRRTHTYGQYSNVKQTRNRKSAMSSRAGPLALLLTFPTHSGGSMTGVARPPLRRHLAAPRISLSSEPKLQPLFPRWPPSEQSTHHNDPHLLRHLDHPEINWRANHPHTPPPPPPPPPPTSLNDAHHSTHTLQGLYLPSVEHAKRSSTRAPTWHPRCPPTHHTPSILHSTIVLSPSDNPLPPPYTPSSLDNTFHTTFFTSAPPAPPAITIKLIPPLRLLSSSLFPLPHASRGSLTVATLRRAHLLRLLKSCYSVGIARPFHQVPALIDLSTRTDPTPSSIDHFSAPSLDLSVFGFRVSHYR